MSYSATYSPEDNKLRLYSTSRLDKELYDRVKKAGFIYAPKQGFFVASMWTPAREDLLIELAGEIGDEDTTLASRAEERADRFTDYHGSRTKEANFAYKAVSDIGARFDFGQPILIGHHSEKRARKDKERMENHMRRAVSLWDTADYWKRRAAGALAHAKYKERPDVRARRIKTIEADLRKQKKNHDEADMWLKLWTECEAEQDAELQMAVALRIAGMSTFYLARKEGDREDHNGNPSAYTALTGEYPGLYAPRSLAEVIKAAKTAYPRRIAFCNRWIAHYENRLAYERAMLAEQGGLAADKFDIQKGGQVKIGGEWFDVVRVNKAGGRINSVTTNQRFVPIRGIEEVQDYRAPSAEKAAEVEKSAKLPPMCNYPGEGFHHITKAEWDSTHKDYKGSRELGHGAKRPGGYRPDIKNSVSQGEQYGRHRVRSMIHRGGLTAVYLTDAKRSNPPAAPATENNSPAEVTQDEIQEIATATSCTAAEQQPATAMASEAPAAQEETTPAPQLDAAAFEAMRQQLKRGVEFVTAPQLFPTPETLAARMVDEAGIKPGMRVLEPSAGTGRILDQLPEGCSVVAVEINAKLGGRLDATKRAVVIGDFLNCSAETLGGEFDAICMNPPFVNADDIKHIRHAYNMLKPGGRLVAICANGPKQKDLLLPFVESQGGIWEVLPDSTFAESGTNVGTAMLILDR